MQEEYIRANTQQIVSNTDYTNTLIKQSDANRKAENAALIAKYNQMIGEVEQTNNSLEQIFSSASSDFDYDDTTDYSLEVDYDETITDTASLNLRDSVMRHKRELDSVIAYVDSVRNDTTTNYVALDSIYDWSDTSSIKQKLSDFFIPGVSELNSCPVFHFEVTWPQPVGEQRWRIDFGNLLNGIDFCSVVRGLVKLGTLIFILFNTIYSFIRAFSSGGT